MTYDALPSQIRAARALLNLSQDDLAKASNVSISTIRDFEAARRQTTAINIAEMRKALEKLGVHFLKENQNTGPGVCLVGDNLKLVRSPTKVNFESDALPFDVLWRGKKYFVFLPVDILEDLDNAPEGYDSDVEYVKSFSRNKEEILKQSLRAIHAGRKDTQNRIRLRSKDFFP